MKFPKPRGFTLIELLVVISIIALVLAVLFPSLDRVRRLGRRAQCSVNLHHIGTAFGTFRGKQEVERGQKLEAVGWHAKLVEYLGGNWSVLICPEDDSPAIDPGDPGHAPSIEGVFVEVFAGELDNPDDWAWDMHLNEVSEWCWKMSQTQFDAFASIPDHGQSYDFTAYIPDDDPNCYWYCFEDQGWLGGGDRDYWDIMLKVEHFKDRTDLTVKKGHARYKFNLRRGQDRQMLIEDMEANDGRTLSFERLAGTAGGSSSYGVNSAAAKLTPAGSGRTIFAVDYYKTVVCGSYRDGDSLDPWTQEEVELFARHLDKVNVLRVDQSVQTMFPDEIDPNNDDETRRVYWDPPEGR